MMYFKRESLKLLERLPICQMFKATNGDPESYGEIKIKELHIVIANYYYYHYYLAI